MASGQQYAELIAELLTRIQGRTGMQVPKSAQNLKTLRLLEQMNERGQADSREFSRELAARSHAQSAERPHEADDLFEPENTDTPPNADQAALDALFNEVQSRTRQTSKQHMSRSDKEAMVPSMDKKLAHQRARSNDPYQVGRRELAQEYGHPTKVGRANDLSEDSYRAYSDDVPVIEENEQLNDIDLARQATKEAIELVMQGKLAGGMGSTEKNLIELLMSKDRLAGQRSSTIQDAFRSGQRFADLSPTRGRGYSVPISEAENVADESASPEALAALAEFFNSMRNK